VTLMSGPPKFRERDYTASLAGSIDLVVLIQIGVWTCGGLWVIAQLYPTVRRRGVIPALHPVQVTAWLLIAALSLSLPESPGVLLTAFTLGQYAVMLSFAWVFAHRFGVSVYLRHLFAGVSLLALWLAAAGLFAPAGVVIGTRLRGDFIADAGAVTVIGLVFCLSNVPALKSRTFWGALLFFGVLLAWSRSRTAFVVFLVYLTIGYAFGKGLRVRKLVPLLAVLSLGLVLLEMSSQVESFVVRDTASLQTMSDRIPLWQYLTAAVMRESPMTGLGYYAASRVLAPRYNFALGNSHSAFFEILVGGGIIASTVYIWLCGLLLWTAGRLLVAAGRRPEVMAAVGLLAATLLMGITSLGLQPGVVGFSFWSLTAVLPALWRQCARMPMRDYQERLLVRRSSRRAQAAAGGRSVMS
jgi:hypothetical protein